MRLLPIVLLVSAFAYASTGFGDTPPGSWGLNVQTLYHGPAIKALGVQWVRLTVRWDTIEKSAPGQYDWTASDKELNYYLDNGFHVICILAVEKLDPLYKASASNQQVINQVVANWMGAAAQHYKGKGIVWEITNEPEAFSMGNVWNNAGIYTAMARLAAQKIKRADPQAKVAALSMAWMDKGFANAALGGGLLADGTIDYLSFHGYDRQTIEPESALEQDVNWLRALAAASPHGSTLPVVIDTETGYALRPFESQKSKDTWRMILYTEEAQAAYLARHYLEEIYLGIPISVWYKDMNGEQSFSLYYGDEKDSRGLRPMGRMYQYLAELLPDNPASLKNDRYSTAVTANNVAAANQQLHQRSYFRAVSGGSPQLIVAVWNAVEAFQGKILANRTMSGTQVTERWRDINSTDLNAVDAKLAISPLAGSSIQSAQLLTFPEIQKKQDTAKLSSSGSGADATTTLVLKATPVPSIVVITLRGVPASPSALRITPPH